MAFPFPWMLNPFRVTVGLEIAFLPTQCSILALESTLVRSGAGAAQSPLSTNHALHHITMNEEGVQVPVKPT